MADNKPLYDLYKGLRADNYDVPESYESFERTLTKAGKTGAASRHTLYEALKRNNYDVPERYESFYSTLFEPVNGTTSRAKGSYGSAVAQKPAAAGQKPAATGQASAQVKPQPAASAQKPAASAQKPATTASAAPAKAKGQEAAKLTPAEMVGYQMMAGDIIRQSQKTQQNFSKRMENIRKGNTPGKTSGMAFNPTTGRMERKYYTTGGDEAGSMWEQSAKNIKRRDEWEATTPEGQAHRERRMQGDYEGRVGAVMDKFDPDNAAEQAWQNAEARTLADRNRHNKEIWDGFAALGGGREARAMATGETRHSNMVDHLRNHDLQRMADEAWNMLGKEKQQAITNDIAEALHNRYPEATDEQIRQAAAGMARERSDQRLYELAVKKNAPRSATEWFFRKAIGDNSLMKLHQALARSEAGTTGDWAAREVAEQEYNHGAGRKAAGIAGTVVGFALDPLTVVSAGAGSGVTKGAMWLGGMAVGEAAMRKGAATLGGRLAMGAVGGAANFGTFEAGSEAVEQLKWGGHRDETGAVGKYSLGAVGERLGHGLVMGATTGVIAPLVGNVSDKLVRATESTAGKAAIRAGEIGVGTVAEGTIFSIPEWMEGQRDAMDVWTDNMAMMAGFKLQHGVKSAPRVIAELARDPRGRKAGFETRLRSALDGSRPDLALTKDEKAELERGGYTDLTQLTEDYGRHEAEKARQEKQKGQKAHTADPGRMIAEGEMADGVSRDIPFNRFEDLMNDGRVSEAARAKMYYYLTGRTLPMSTVMGSSVVENKDADGNVKGYTVRSFGANGVITSRSFADKGRADVEARRINDDADYQAELNTIDVGERHFDWKGDNQRMWEACQAVAEETGAPANRLYELMRSKPETMNGVELEWARKIMDAHDQLGDKYGSSEVRTAINEEYGVDVDKAIRKEPGRRSEQEQKALEEYAKRLFADVKTKEEDAAQGDGQNGLGGPNGPDDADGPNGPGWTDGQAGADGATAADPTAAVRQRGYDADAQERRDIAIELARDGNAEAQEAWDGVVERINDDADYQAAQKREVAQKMQHTKGGIRPALLKEQDADGNNKVVYIVDGEVTMMDDGSTVDKTRSDKSVAIYDPATDERRMIDPSADTGILGIQEMIGVVDYDRRIESERQEYVRQQMDEAQGKVRLAPGQQITLPTGEDAVVMATEGDNVTVRLADGYQRQVGLSDLQRISDEKALADYNERHGINREQGAEAEGGAEQSQGVAGQEPVTETPRGVEYGVNDTFTFLDGEGATIHGEVQNISEDGVEIRTDVPLNGKRVQVIPADEFERRVESVSDADGNPVWARERAGEGVSPTPAEAAEGGGLVTGAPADYTPDMEITVRDEDGTEKPAMVMGRVRYEKGAFVPDENGSIVEYYMDGEVKHDHVDKLRDKVVSHVEAGQTEAEGSPVVEEEPKQEGAPAESAVPAAEPKTEAPVEHPQAPAKTEGAEAAREAMPMREDGEEDWQATTPERAHQYIYNEAGLSKDEGNQFVAAKADAAEKALAKAQSAQMPQVGTSIQKYNQAKAKRQEKIDEAQRAVDYWNRVREMQDGIQREEKAHTEKITPVGEGDFGFIYDQFKGNAQGAIQQLMKMQDGEALGALHHDEIGDIDLVWGKAGTKKSDGYGLAKLVKFHPEVLDNLQGILDGMHVTMRSENRVQLENNEYQAAVRLTWNGEEKLWLLTAFKKKETSEPTNSRTDVDSNLDGKSDDTATRQSSDVSASKDRNNPSDVQGKTEKNADEAALERQKSLAERKRKARERAQRRVEAQRLARKRARAEAEKGYDMEPHTPTELAASMLGGGSIRLERSSFLRHTGYGNAEARRMLGLLASREKGGMTMEEAGEQVLLADEELGYHLLDHSDANAGLDAVIDALHECRTKGELQKYILNNRIREREGEEEAEREREEAARDEFYYEQYHLTYDEYVIYTEEVLPLYYEEESRVPEEVRVANLEEMAKMRNDYENNGRETGGSGSVREERLGEQGRDAGGDEVGGPGGEDTPDGQMPDERRPVLGGSPRGASDRGAEGLRDAGAAPLSAKIDWGTREEPPVSEAEWMDMMRFEYEGKTVPEAKDMRSMKRYVDNVLSGDRGIDQTTSATTATTSRSAEIPASGLYNSEVAWFSPKKYGDFIAFFDEGEKAVYKLSARRDGRGRLQGVTLTKETFGNEGETSPSTSAGENKAYTVTPTTYTNKKGKTTPMHLVKFDHELTKEQKSAGKELAKESRGWWDSKQGGFMMRSEEAARELAEALGSDEAVQDAQPMSAKDMEAANDKAAGHVANKKAKTEKKPQPGNRVDMEETAQEQPQTDANETANGEAKQEKAKAKSKWVDDADAERFEELRKRLRMKLGGQLNMGIDPEAFSIGVEMSFLMLKHGARKFSEYAKNMIEALGENVRPYLKSFYNGARDLPEMADLEKELTPYDEVRAFDVKNFDKKGAKDLVATAEHIVREQAVEREAKEATDKLKSQRNEQRKEADEQRAAGTVALAAETETDISEAETHAKTSEDRRAVSQTAGRVDDDLDKVNGQLALLGYYEAGHVAKDYDEAYGYMRNAEKKAVKDATNLASQLVDDLGLDRYEATHSDKTDKKGNRKTKPLAVANIAPAGGDITMHLPLAEGRELYVNIQLEPTFDKGDADRRGDNLEVTGIMCRVENPNVEGNGRYGQDVWFMEDVPYDELLKNVQRVAQNYLPKHEAEVPQNEDIFQKAERIAKEAKAEREKKAAEEADIMATDLPEPAKEKAVKALHGSASMTDNAALAEAQRQVAKKKASKKKVKQEQQVGDLFAGLFDEPKDNGLQRNDDAVRTEAVPTDHSGQQQGLRGGERTPRKAAAQESGRPDGRREGQGAGNTGPVSAGLHGLTEAKNTRNNRSERGADHAPTTVNGRIEANVKAIRLARELLESGETATPEQMAVLRQFSGWGGLGGALDYTGSDWKVRERNKQIRELLGEEAYEQAVMSSKSAYYTPAYVVDTLWDIARQLGFKGGQILEGSAGIGNILGQMPAEVSGRSDIHAIEIDGTSGGILSLLYPDAKVDIQGFEDTRIPNGSVDLAITNVPFVTGLHVKDKTGDGDLSRKFRNIHDFCIAKNVRKLREGGLGIFISSNGTLDNSKALRDWVVNEGGSDFIGAFRMNNETFGGTPVTSDVIVIRKRVNGQKSPQAIDVSAISGERTAEYQEPGARKAKQLSMDYNKYFIEHPDHMAGEMRFGFEEGDKTYRPTSKGLYPVSGKDQGKMLSDFVKTFTEETGGSVRAASEATPNIYEDLGEGVKEGSMVVDKNGNICTAHYGKAVPVMSKRKTGETATDEELVARFHSKKIKGHTKQECFNAYSAIKSALSDVMEYQTTHEDNAGLQPLLAKLNKAYDDFVATYGHFNKNNQLAWLRRDVDYPNVFSLETYEEQGDGKGGLVKTYGKADVLKGRVVEKEREPHPETVKDGVVVSMFKNGRIDIPYIAGQLGKSEEAVKREIIDGGLGFEDPATRQVEVSYQYLSGNVREKLRQAEANNENGEYTVNIKALRDVVPMDIPAHLIDFTLGSSWLDPKLYDAYVKDRTDIDVHFTAAGGSWYMKAPSYGLNVEKNRSMGVTSEMLDKTVMGHELIEAAIQNKTIVVSQTKRHYDGTTETITDREATAACASKIDEIRQDFKEWARQKMQSEADLSARIEREYNDRFNNYVPMRIPDEFVPEFFGGATHKFKMRPHQGKAIVRGTMQPLLLAHEVGTGKTFTLISTAMEMRRLGTARKPMIVVQNATVGQFAASAKELYPNAKILTLEDNDRDEDGRKNFYAKIKYNDWDMIVVPQSTFEFIPDSDERQMQFIRDKIEEKMLVLEQMREADDTGRSAIVRNAEKELASLEAELAEKAEDVAKKRAASEKQKAVARQNASVKAQEMLDRRTDDVENFDDMGIDALLIDEAHEYKHLGFATAMQRGVKGVDPSFSKKSQGVYLKTQAVLEKMGGRNVVFATGTPISNTAAEIWTFMRYLMPRDTMKEYGIQYFDDFVRNFGNIQQMPEFKTSGKFQEVNRFAGYVNLPELVRIWSGAADTVLTKDQKDLVEKIPAMEGGKAQDIYLPQTRALRSVMKYVREQLEEYEKMSGKEKKENSHIPLTMYGIAQGAAVDARLVQVDAEDDPKSKTNEAVRQTLRSLKETDGYKGTVAIFADHYMNKRNGFNLYEDIKKKLVAQGVPASEVVVMKSGMKIKQKLDIFEKVNRGEVRVIMGSTATLGTGVNIQERLHTLIHLDAPNRPMDYTQRNGRILRQGNLHKQWDKPVRVLRFGVEDSLDVTAYQRLKTKGAIADSIMEGDRLMKDSMNNRVLEEEEDVFGDTVAQLSGSEYALLKNNAEKNVRKYESRKRQWEADQTYIHNAKPKLEGQIRAADQRAEEAKAHLQAVQVAFPDGTFTEITAGKHKFGTVDAMADFIKEHNKKILDAMKAMKSTSGNASETHTLTLSLGGYDFTLKTDLTRETVNGGGTLFAEVHRKMTYSCPELGLEDVPVKQALLRNAVEDITGNVITGKDFAERLDYATRAAAHGRSELEQLKQREGKPFEFGKELEEAKRQLEEYTEAMKEELAAKEAKYAEMDASVEAATDLVVDDDEENGEDNVKFRLLDDDDPKALELEALPESELVPVYRNVQVFEDDDMGSPMAFTDAETGERRTLQGGKWNATAQEDIELTPEQQRQLDELNRNGYLVVDGKKTNELKISKSLFFKKGKTGDAQLQYWLKKGPEDKGVPAAYDPYDHAIEWPLNTQFGTAYKRPNLVVVRSLIPKSEIDDPYQAKYALLPTGAHEWNNGRTLYLSRWSKIDKVLTREEEAKLIDEYWKENPGKREALKSHRDYNRFVPQVRRELEKMGYRFELDGKELTPEESLALDERNWEDRDVIPGREGHVPFVSNEDIARINAKMSGKWVGEPKAAMESAMMARVNELSERLHTPVRIIRTDEEVAALPSARQRRMKGSFNPLTGEVTIVVPNNANVADVENTFVHEVVGHNGLRVLFPEEEKLNNALDELYRVSNGSIQQVIDRRAQKMYDAEVDRLRERKRKAHEAKGEDGNASYYVDMAEAHAEASKKREQFRRDATEEYGADLAGRIGEEGFEKMSAEELTFWGKLKAMLQKALQRLLEGLKIPGSKKWSDKEWAFVLHEAYKRKKNGGKPDLLDAADTVVMREKTGFGEEHEKSAEHGEARLNAFQLPSDARHNVQPSEAAPKHLEPTKAEHGAKVLQNREKTKEALANVADAYRKVTDTKGFLTALKDAMGLTGNGSSAYRSFELPNGDTFVMRVSNHNAKAHNAKDGERVESIVIKRKHSPNSFEPAAGKKVDEYVYFKEDIRKAPAGTLSSIAESISELLDTGEYHDKTGLAKDNHSPETDLDGGIMFRDGDSEEYEKALARDIYEQRVSRGMYQTQEALQDSMLGLKEAMDAILKADGKGKTYIEDVAGYENAYLGENRLSSVNQAECAAFAQTLFKPMLEEVAKLAKTADERAALTDYMMAKHGLERNEVMARHAADRQAEQEFSSELLKAARALAKDPLDQLLADALDDVRQRRDDRAAELYMENRGRDYSGLTALTGTDNVVDAEDEARRLVADYEQAHATDALWDKVNAVTKATLQKTYESGLINKATYDDIRGMYKHYIPLRGFDDTTSDETYAYLADKHSAFNAPIKTAKGRKSKADDPLANMEAMAESAIMQGNRNVLVKQKFLNFALNHPSDLVSVSDLWLRHDDVKDEWLPVNTGDIAGTEALEEDDSPQEVERKMLAFEAAMEQAAAQDPVHFKKQKDAPDIPYRVVESRDLRQHQVLVKRNGRDILLTINGNPRAAQALNGQTNPDNDVSGAIGAIMHAGEAVNRQLSAFYTTRNPDFVVSNFVRDMIYSNTMTWVKESPDYALRFHKNFGKVNPVKMKLLFAKLRKGTLDMSDETEKMFHQFIMNGGETGYANIRDIEQRKNDIKREMKMYNGKLPLRKAWRLLGERLDEYNRSVETCARFAAFVTSRQMGRTIERSVWDAKEISVNFNKKGSGAKFMGAKGQTKVGNAAAFTSGLGRSFYVFWNAGIQGMTNFGRQFGRHPKKAVAGAATMFLLGALMSAIGGGDDDGDKDAYNNLPEYVRRSNIVFRVPGMDKSWISMPLPVEYRAMYGLGELAMSVAVGREHYTDGELAHQMASQVSQLLPIDFLEGGGGVKPFVPSWAKPFSEVWMNESWTGMPIYKDTPYNKEMPEWTKAYKRANSYLVGLSKALNEATGGDAYTSGAVDINPAQVEYLLNGVFGGLSRSVDELTKMGETAIGQREYDPRGFMFLNRLVKNGDERTEYRAVNNEYFRIKEASEKLRKRLNHYEDDTADGVYDYSEKIARLNNSPEYRILETYEDYSADIDAINDELKDVMPDEERKELEAELNQKKKELVDAVNEIRNGKQSNR